MRLEEVVLRVRVIRQVPDTLVLALTLDFLPALPLPARHMSRKNSSQGSLLLRIFHKKP
jgi:hypothetical protein